MIHNRWCSFFNLVCKFQALLDICHKINQALPSNKPGKRVAMATVGKVTTEGSLSAGAVKSKGANISAEEKPFDRMNNIVANLLLNLTR